MPLELNVSCSQGFVELHALEHLIEGILEVEKITTEKPELRVR